MTFADAIRTIASSTTRDAAKRPAWGGYVYRGAIDATTGGYTLTYKNRSGTTYAYTFSGSAWTAPSTALSIDGELQAAFVADDWIVGTATDFEASRAGSGTW